MTLEAMTFNYCELYFDGAASSLRGLKPLVTLPRNASIGIYFLTLNLNVLQFSYDLLELCKYNEVECEALIDTLDMAIFLGISTLNIDGGITSIDQ